MNKTIKQIARTIRYACGVALTALVYKETGLFTAARFSRPSGSFCWEDL